MPAHQRVCTWIAQNYKKPAIDQEWLSECSAWLTSELGLDPDRDFDQFIQSVESQLLQSNLADSTVPGSGIDPQLFVASNPNHARPRPSVVRRPGCQASRPKKTTGPTPLLVEIKSITEIAHSAFSLLNTHQTRLDRADLGLAREEVPEQPRDEDEGPVPNFPRGMLRFELSDGLTTFRAIEFRSLPKLELGTTPLGYKMFLNSTPVRNGIAFLEPANVTLKGFRTEDHDVNREQVFLSSLRKRLGRPEPSSEGPSAPQPPVNPPPQPTLVQPARQRQPVSEPRPPPLRAEIDDMYVDDDVDSDVLYEMALQMDEEADMRANQQVNTRAPPPAKPPPISKGKYATSSNPKQVLRPNSSSSVKTLSTSTAKTSHYFSAHTSESRPIPDIGLSPRPAPPSHSKLDFDIPSDIDDWNTSQLPVRMSGSTSTELSSVTVAISPGKRAMSPDSFDNLSFDMDVDDSFLEQVGMIEKSALGSGSDNKGKEKCKDAGKEGTPMLGRSSEAAGRRVPTGSAPGTTHLAPHPVSLSVAESSITVQSGKEKVPSPSSLSGSTESFMPPSTQSSDRRLLRDPSSFVISSEDEAQGSHSTARPLDLARRRANKGRKVDRKELVDPDVIDISD